jgi:hypothetical protein
MVVDDSKNDGPEANISVFLRLRPFNSLEYNESSRCVVKKLENSVVVDDSSCEDLKAEYDGVSLSILCGRRRAFRVHASC